MTSRFKGHVWSRFDSLPFQAHLGSGFWGYLAKLMLFVLQLWQAGTKWLSQGPNIDPFRSKKSGVHRWAGAPPPPPKAGILPSQPETVREEGIRTSMEPALSGRRHREDIVLRDAILVRPNSWRAKVWGARRRRRTILSVPTAGAGQF